MAFQNIPIKSSPSQTLDVVLGGQNVTIVLQTRLGKLYADIAIDNVAAVRGRLCHDRLQILNEEFRGFKGELFFIDSVANEDPTWEQMGVDKRFSLMYWDGAEE